MHPSPVFRRASREANLAVARERSFGVLAVDGGAGGPLLSHIPFVLAEDGAAVHAHLVRSNPIAQCLAAGEQPAVLAVGGPDGYISPDWYEAGTEMVPTWNYVAVHLRGVLRLRPQETLREHLDELSAQYEQRLLPKPPWRTAKVPDRHLEALMRAIQPVELAVEAVDGTWKLNQNRAGEARLKAADRIEAEGFGMETALLARLMRTPPQPE